MKKQNLLERFRERKLAFKLKNKNFICVWKLQKSPSVGETLSVDLAKKKKKTKQNNVPWWGELEEREGLCVPVVGDVSVAVRFSFLNPPIAYHSFFFSSMDTPPGPSATTKSRPPMTEVVWKKSYLRKSCMGL